VCVGGKESVAEVDCCSVVVEMQCLPKRRVGDKASARAPIVAVEHVSCEIVAELIGVWIVSN
jgi:hypothetical protein